MTRAPTRTTSVPVRGSGTRRKSGIEKAAHQTAALRKDSRIAVAASGMPNQAGCWIQSALTASSSPPERIYTYDLPARPVANAADPSLVILAIIVVIAAALLVVYTTLHYRRRRLQTLEHASTEMPR